MFQKTWSYYQKDCDNKYKKYQKMPKYSCLLLALYCLIALAVLFWAICFINTAAIHPVKAEDKPRVEYNSLPVNQDKPYTEIVAEITAYNAEVGQCDERPFEMANGENVHIGALACPRNLKFGVAVEILGKMYVCKDRMNARYTNNFDIFMWDKQEALNFGRKVKIIKIYK